MILFVELFANVSVLTFIWAYELLDKMKKMKNVLRTFYFFWWNSLSDLCDVISIQK